MLKKFRENYGKIAGLEVDDQAVIFILAFMKYLISLVVLLILSAPAMATEKAAPVAEPPAPSVNKEEVKQLIETLESETARTEFLSNLKLMLDEQKKEEDPALGSLPLTEQIGVRGFISDQVDHYEGFLARHNLSGSLVNQVLGSVIVLIVGLLLSLGEDRLNRKLTTLSDSISAFFTASVTRLRWYVRLIHWISEGLIFAVGLYTLAIIWGVKAVDQFFESESVRSVLSSTLTITLVIFLAAILWEAINLYLIYVLHKADNANNTRSKTLLPIIRNIFFMIFGGLFGLVLLSEFGINVTPLLAGAGVIGVAVGFGAQSIVKDYLSGFTIVLEDLVRVGDVVNIAGFSGTVEQITLRKIQLRDMSGTVFTIPYSEIKVIQNLTKDFSYYVLDIGVAYNQSIDHVIETLRAVDEDLRKDDIFSFMILEPIEIFGVDKFADSAIIIKARIKDGPAASVAGRAGIQSPHENGL